MLQLWLYAIFSHAPDIQIPSRTEVGAKGTRLAQLTPDDGQGVSKEAFEKYFYIFYKYNTFDPSMEPFMDQLCGIAWFHTPFPNPATEEAELIHNVLLEFLRPTPLWMRLTIKKTRIILGLYQPYLVSRKFGLSQMLPKPLVPNMKGVVLFTDALKEETLEVCLEYF